MWLADGTDDAAAARTVVIALRSDDPDDLTLREARWLASADLVVHSADIPVAILARARADAAREAGEDTPADVSGLMVIIRR
jgi:uroporphyrin-III C-methyltransferase / precorrin-2 dehydrogenase / sirohydrochlorin ferrochelatase